LATSAIQRAGQLVFGLGGRAVAGVVQQHGVPGLGRHLRDAAPMMPAPTTRTVVLVERGGSWLAVQCVGHACGIQLAVALGQEGGKALAGFVGAAHAG
jgi:hypothetical protein